MSVSPIRRDNLRLRLAFRHESIGLGHISRRASLRFRLPSGRSGLGFELIYDRRLPELPVPLLGHGLP